MHASLDVTSITRVSQDLLAIAIELEKSITSGIDRGVSGSRPCSSLKICSTCWAAVTPKAPALHSDSALERAIGLGSKMQHQQFHLETQTRVVVYCG